MTQGLAPENVWGCPAPQQIPVPMSGLPAAGERLQRRPHPWVDPQGLAAPSQLEMWGELRHQGTQHRTGRGLHPKEPFRASPNHSSSMDTSKSIQATKRSLSIVHPSACLHLHERAATVLRRLWPIREKAISIISWQAARRPPGSIPKMRLSTREVAGLQHCISYSRLVTVLLMVTSRSR